MNIIDSGAAARVASARGQMRGGACYWGVDLLGGWKTPQEEGVVGGGLLPEMLKNYTLKTCFTLSYG